MSMQSVDTIEPSSTAEVCDSAESQTKISQQQQSNDAEQSEKSIASTELVVNGQDGSTTDKNSDSAGLDTKKSVQESTAINGTTDTHINGHNQAESASSSTNDNANPIQERDSTPGAIDLVEKSNQKESTTVSSDEVVDSVVSATSEKKDIPSTTEPEPALSTSVVEVKESVSSTAAANVDTAPTASSSVEATPVSENTSAVTAAVSEAPIQADLATPERKSRTPRGKAKAPVVATTPTRQSTRARKPVAIASDNDDDDDNEKDTIEEATPSKTPRSARGSKRQAVTTAKVVTPSKAATPSKDTTSAKDPTPTTTTAGSSSTEAVKSQPEKHTTRSDVQEKSDSTEGKRRTTTPRRAATTTTTTATPVNTGKKRAASPSPSSTKKLKTTPKGRQSTTKVNEEKMDVESKKGNETAATKTSTAIHDTGSVQTPPKKARTSANRKTPTSKTPESSDEYLRKLRPRK